MENGTKSHGKNFISFKILIGSIIYCPSYYNVSINKYGVKCRTSLRFGKIKAGLIK